MSLNSSLRPFSNTRCFARSSSVHTLTRFLWCPLLRLWLLLSSGESSEGGLFIVGKYYEGVRWLAPGRRHAVEKWWRMWTMLSSWGGAGQCAGKPCRNHMFDHWHGTCHKGYSITHHLVGEQTISLGFNKDCSHLLKNLKYFTPQMFWNLYLLSWKIPKKIAIHQQKLPKHGIEPWILSLRFLRVTRLTTGPLGLVPIGRTVGRSRDPEIIPDSVCEGLSQCI